VLNLLPNKDEAPEAAGVADKPVGIEAPPACDWPKREGVVVACDIAGCVAEPKRPPVAGLASPAGGAPAGVVDPIPLKRGFAGVACVLTPRPPKRLPPDGVVTVPSCGAAVLVFGVEPVGLGPKRPPIAAGAGALPAAGVALFPNKPVPPAVLVLPPNKPVPPVVAVVPALVVPNSDGAAPEVVPALGVLPNRPPGF